MDDMRNTSAPLYGKAEPATTKTTMSVREMRQLLGLGKTDSYWILHKNLFEVILINDKRRIVISSFEKWYANQVKYHKVNGSQPGEELCKRSYSVPDAAEILKVKPETIYTLIRQGKLKAETVDFWMRIPKEEFERWYFEPNPKISQLMKSAEILLPANKKSGFQLIEAKIAVFYALCNFTA